MAPTATSTASRDAEVGAEQRPREHAHKERPVDTARRVLRERRWAIVAVTLIFTAVAVFFDTRTERLYSATATVDVQAATQEAPLVYVRKAHPAVEPETEAARLGSVILPEVIVDASRRLQRAHPGTPLVGTPIAIPVGPGVARIGVVHRDPQAAAWIANALADAVAARMRRDEIDAIDEVRRAIRHRLRHVSRGAAGSFAARIGRDVTKGEMAVFRIRRDTAVGAEVVSRAVPPAKASYEPGKRIPPAFVLGLSLALIAAFLLDRIDRRPRDPRRLAAGAGLPLAGVVPKLGRRSGDPSEAFRRILTVAQAMPEATPGVLAVSSPQRGEGRSTVAVGLAEAAAGAGLRACVVEGDVYRPVLASRLGLDGPGLAGVLGGRAPLHAAVHAASEDAPGVDVLPAGDAGGLLDLGGELDELIAELRHSYELVLIDCPPLGAGPEAWLLAKRADVVLLCARPGRTPADSLRAAHRDLERAHHGPVCLVVSGSALPGFGASEPRAVRRSTRRWVAAGRSVGEGG